MTPSFFVSLASLVFTVLLVELTLWTLFRKRIAHMCFPKEADASMLGFFTFARMSVVAIAHTVFLVITIIFFYFLLW